MGTAEIIVAVNLGIRLLMEIIELIDVDPNRTLSADDRAILRANTQALIDRASKL